MDTYVQVFGVISTALGLIVVIFRQLPFISYSI